MTFVLLTSTEHYLPHRVQTTQKEKDHLTLQATNTRQDLSTQRVKPRQRSIGRRTKYGSMMRNKCGTDKSQMNSTTYYYEENMKKMMKKKKQLAGTKKKKHALKPNKSGNNNAGYVKNISGYKGKPTIKNKPQYSPLKPQGADGQPLKCSICGSLHHLRMKCLKGKGKQKGILLQRIRTNPPLLHYLSGDC
eukprot:606299-Amphidinium_carterae.2